MTHVDPATAVVLAVCTFDRPGPLTALLHSAVDVAADEAGPRPFAVVVVDDHPSGNAAEACAAVAALTGADVTYHHLGSCNIARARTTAVEMAAERGEYVICVDDDCLPEAGWLSALVHMADELSADIVVGHHEFYAPPGSPPWLASEPFLLDHALFSDGSIPAGGNMANMLLRSAWLRSSGVRFRRDMGVSGGEDMVFFGDARAAGAEIRFAAGSLVREPFSGSRATLGYHLWRQMWLGNNEARINRRVRSCSNGRLVLRAGRRILRGVAHPVVRVATRRTSEWRWGLARVGSGVGLLLGVAGVKVTHRT